jgi:hypothetical protein
MVLMLLLSLLVITTVIYHGINIIKTEILNHIDNSENADINITGVALHISKYGAEELKQLLELMQLKQENNLYSCRPLKVIHYLKVPNYLFIFFYVIKIN